MVTPGLVGRFTAAAEEAGAEVVEARDQEAAAAAVRALLEKEGIETVAAGPGQPDFGGGIRVVRPNSAEEFAGIRAGVVRADSGAAETGTLVRLDSGDGEKLAWTLPSLCVCLLSSAGIVPDLDSLSDVIAGHLAGAARPGPQVSLVTGPSRTADIEGELTIGVQGPARLVIALYGEAQS
jgi:L-lactate dehydrogenase complex protein LldG